MELEQEQYEDIDNFQPQHQNALFSGAAAENCRYPHIVLVPAPHTVGTRDALHLQFLPLGTHRLQVTHQLPDWTLDTAQQGEHTCSHVVTHNEITYSGYISLIQSSPLYIDAQDSFEHSQ